MMDDGSYTSQVLCAASLIFGGLHRRRRRLLAFSHTTRFLSTYC